METHIETLDVVIKTEPKEYSAASVSDVNHLFTENGIKEKECYQDYSWSRQLTSISAEPDLMMELIKPESQSSPDPRSVLLMPIKEETPLDVPTYPLNGNQGTGLRLVTCYHCGQYWTSLKELKHHIRRKHNLLLRNPEPQKEAKAYTTLISSSPQSHEQKRHKMKSKLKGNTLFLCSFCDYGTNKSGRLQQHMSTHLKGEELHEATIVKKNPYQCPFCEYFSPHPQILNHHIKDRHTEVKPYQCPHCDHAATWPGILKTHIMSVHMKEKPHVCPHCDYATTWPSSLKIHIMAIHMKEKPHQCPHCEYCTTLSSTLKTHIKSVHMKEKPHHCPHCDYSATLSATVKTHIMSVHKKETFHNCPHCDYATTWRSSLKTHILSVHMKEKPHQCPHCDYSATQSGSLKNHILSIHKKEKPHQCPHCVYSATLSGTLKNHIMTVHKQEKPHRCPYCDYSATRSNKLKTHLSVHQKEKCH